MEERRKKPLIGSADLWGVAVLVLALPNGALAGIMLGLISDFGVRNTVDSMRANSQIFADQYARLLVYSGWIALVCQIALIVIVGIQLSGRKKEE